MINVNKRMYLTNQHKYILSSQQDTGSMNIKGRSWESNKIQRHFDGTVGDNTAIVFKNLTKSLNLPHVNINLMQFNTFSTQLDVRSLTIEINENSKGYLNVTYGAGYNSYSETLISNLPNSNVQHVERKLSIVNNFKNEQSPILGTVSLEPKSNDGNSDDRDANSFRGVVTLTYLIANKFNVSEQLAKCTIYFLPHTKLRIESIDGYTDFIMDVANNTLIYPNPTKLPSPSLKNERIDGIYTIPIVFTNSFGIDDQNTYVKDSNMTSNQLAILAYIRDLLTAHVAIPNNYNFMYFSTNHFDVQWGTTSVIEHFNVNADKCIYAGKIAIKSHTGICDTHNDVILALTFDNTENIGYIKTIYSDVAPLIKVLTIVKSAQSGTYFDILSPQSNSITSDINFDQTITVIVKNQSSNDINVKISETVVANDTCSNESQHDSNLYECEKELNISNNPALLTHIIKPGNYAMFERVLFSPAIWEASAQTKIILRLPTQSHK